MRTIDAETISAERIADQNELKEEWAKRMGKFCDRHSCSLFWFKSIIREKFDLKF